jgi:hypothetical protein
MMPTSVADAALLRVVPTGPGTTRCAIAPGPRTAPPCAGSLVIRHGYTSTFSATAWLVGCDVGARVALTRALGLAAEQTATVAATWGAFLLHAPETL